MNPEGVIYSYSHIPAIGEREAYNVVLVDLDDGFRMMSTCVGLLAGELQIGMRVVAGVEQDCSPARIIFRKAE